MTVAVPDFRVLLGQQDLSPRIRPRLISLRLVERRGGEADQLDIVLDDSDGRLMLPPEGAELTLQLGWSAGSDVPLGLIDKGRFIVDELEHSGPPDTLTIRARSADFTSAIATRREQSWHDTTLGDILRQIAGRHGLAVRCAPALAAMALKALSQSRESDIAFLRRLGREHDALATIKAGSLIFAPIGAGTTAGGQPLPSTVIRRRDGDRHTFRIEKRQAVGRVTAAWHDRSSAKRKTVTAGAGDGPERKLARVFPSQEAARRAAEAEARRGARAPRKLSLNLALARLDLYPEQKMRALGFKAEIDGTDWLLAEVEHQLDGSGGFASQLQLELTG
jgi:phage protein D